MKKIRKAQFHKARVSTGSLVRALILFLSMCSLVWGIAVSAPSGQPLRASANAQSSGGGKSSSTNAQGTSSDGVWQNVGSALQATSQSAQFRRPRSYETFALSQAALEPILRDAPMEFAMASRKRPTILTLPGTDGTFARFAIAESPILAPELAARFPEIKTYLGKGIDDPSATTRFDWTPTGFHAIILSTRGTVLIEPSDQGSRTNHIAYSQSDMPVDSLKCEVTESEQEAAIDQNQELNAVSEPNLVFSSGPVLSTYRLAVAATAEYTQTYGGGTVNGGLAAITTTINLVDAIYEREVAIRLTLIANETSIIFTDPDTDGYTSNNVNSLISENQTKLTAVIGSENYDIGHVFDGRSAGGGFSWQGIAGIEVVCVPNSKGRGVDIFRSLPPTSVFTYYSAAHEIGHQFGATHTFNATSGTCGAQRSSSTAYEPANGSTIMAYRLACSPEDLASTDTYFHAASIDQIVRYTGIGNGQSCRVTSPTGNQAPNINAGPHYTIPMDTPFTLTATGSDPDGDPLTFSWEELDLGSPSPPSTDDGSRPIFRSFAPASSPSRTFPRIQDVLFGTQTFGESLPTTTRTMVFGVTGRDNRTGGGGVGFSSTEVNVRADSGPFRVSQPISSTSWTTASTQAVTWNVANTNNAPVSCTNVKISLSTDGGSTFPIILASNTLNDGSETVTIPGTPSSSARVKVEAIGNIFFNISQSFVISGAATSAPTIAGFTPSNGVAGTSVTINGTNFINPSAVFFNGVSASFTVNSTTEIVATVPSGATTGPISVTTPAGSVTSAANFTVPLQYFVTGQVKDNGNNPLSGVLITFDMDFQGMASSKTTQTDANGNYSSGDLGCKNRVTTTPSKTDYSFSPLSISFVSTQCLSGGLTVNFTGTSMWRPAVLAASQVEVKAWTFQGRTYAYVKLLFPTAGYRVTNWGQATRAGSDFAADAVVERFIGPTVQAVTTTAQIYDLGPLADGNYTFTFKNAGTALKTLIFNVSSAAPLPNPIDNAREFVKQQYRDFLNREPDQAGEDFWTDNITKCNDPARRPPDQTLQTVEQCTVRQRETTSGAFFLSPEFQYTGYFVYRMYQGGLGRQPKLSEFIPDAQFVGNGIVVNGQLSGAKINQNKAAFSTLFVNCTDATKYRCAEFKAIYDGLSNQQYVDKLFLTTGVNASASDRTALVDGLNGGTETRATVLQKVVDGINVISEGNQQFTTTYGQAFYNNEFNRAFVELEYFGYMKRDPDDAGYAFWLGKLNQFGGNFVNAEMVLAFISSPEYRARFGQP